MTDAVQLLAEVQGIASTAERQGRELTTAEAARIRDLYRQLDDIEAEAEAADGWQSR